MRRKNAAGMRMPTLLWKSLQGATVIPFPIRMLVDRTLSRGMFQKFEKPRRSEIVEMHGEALIEPCHALTSDGGSFTPSLSAKSIGLDLGTDEHLPSHSGFPGPPVVQVVQGGPTLEISLVGMHFVCTCENDKLHRPRPVCRRKWCCTAPVCVCCIPLPKLCTVMDSRL